jgi:L-alanine-DL-glutamate epimerase-like enolase superfamily enzyme
MGQTIRITSIAVAPLFGESPKGGWSAEIRPEDSIHALIAVQTDATKVGGISEQRRIAWMADDFGVRYVGHGWNTALGLAADLQLAAALPNVDLVEFIGGSPYADGVTETPFALDDEGWLAIPDTPGLGVLLSREKLGRFTPDPGALFAA